jgi:hypothetical protein
MPPPFGLLTAIIVLGVFDALAGAAAAAAFSVCVVLSGGIVSTSSVRMLLAVAVLAFVAPLTASKARSLRRKSGKDLTYWVDRAGDFVIAGLLAAYGVEKLISGLKPLSTLSLPVTSHVAAIAVAVLLAVFARYLIETAVVHWYPYRLSQVAIEKIRPPSPLQSHLSRIFQTLLFIFVAAPVLGHTWELYVGALVFWFCSFMSNLEKYMPDAPWLKRLVPKGYVKSVVMLVVGSALAVVVTASVHNRAEELSVGFVIFMLPGLLLGLADASARNGPKFKVDWATRAGGAIVLVAGVLLAQGIITLNW